MTDYGPQDTSTTTLGANQFPIAENWTPNAGFSAVEGGPQSTDAGGKKSAPVSVYAKDGSNVTQGAQADAAYTDGTGAASGTGMGLFKGIFVKLAAIAGSVAGTLKVKGDFTEVAGQGTGVVNAQNTDLIPSTDVSAYKWFSLQIAGTFSLTLTVQVSNDNTNWQAVRVQNTLAQIVNFDTLTLAGTYDAPVKYRFLRVRATTFTSNTSLVGTLELYTSPAAMNVQVATQGGTWTVQPGNTANTTPWLVQQNVAAAPSYVFKPVKNVAVTAGTPVSIWTPTSGKKFRLIGANLYPTATLTSGILLEDATGAGNEFMRFPRLNSANTAPTPITLGPNGYLSTTINNQLFIDVTTSCSVEGFVWGTEE